MRRLLLRSLWFAPLLVIALAAGCGKKETPATPETSSPEETVRASLVLLRDGQFDAFWQHALPPADYRDLKADWPKRDAANEPLTADDRERFATGVKRLTEADAEKKLFASLKPTLIQYDREYKDQMILTLGIFQSMAITAIDQAKDLTLSQKRQLRDALVILNPWAQTVPWGDQAKAKEAIAIVTDTARKLNLSTPEDMRTMDFDTSMKRYAIVWSGLKRTLDVYGLSLDKSFDSVAVDTLENGGGSAHVKIRYTLLDKPMETEATLVQLDGRWYDSDMLQSVREQHARLMPPATPAPTTSAPLPAPASSVPSTAGAPVADAPRH
ncbi:hypothetical protein EC912_102574 [Luteibacter rhizovicinus]|uniref:LPP20 lipoprotein n=1 Tax=Luteibacter rhizovicinus TaxID=242606 RepID=A0A4R3YXN3_9GAMM|nr:hypothetical protein [Luteibacter rhizovicinus]TCV96224.1 hypothetical protein EC912_102574 [Luteibacter rhizovicinus]